jgi:hypothetical protein
MNNLATPRIDDRVGNDDECGGCVDNDNEEHGDDE